MIDVGLNGLNAVQAVAPECGRYFIRGKIFPHMPIRLERVNCYVFHHIGEAFVEPQVVPPVHGNEIAKPLMAELVRDNRGNEASG